MALKTKTPAKKIKPQTIARPAASAVAVLPPAFNVWFAKRGWTPRPHQLALIEKVSQRRSTLLIAPTGAGKTLAGFLPSLLDLQSNRHQPARATGSGLHTLYISPLKALAVDVARNLIAPIGEMGLASTDINPDGLITLRETVWKARTNRATPLRMGESARVVAVEGLVLEVEPEAGGAKDYRDRGGPSAEP